MTESRFLSCVICESILLLCLGLCMLILPKVSIVSFGFMMCFSFIAFGGYKIISSFITKNFSRHFILDIILGAIITLCGILLLTLEAFDITVIIGLTAVYFVLKSISSTAFSIQTRKTLNFWWMSMFLGILELFFGMIIILTLPSAALWLMGILTGIDFILSGMIYMNMYISTKYMQGV